MQSLQAIELKQQSLTIAGLHDCKRITLPHTLTLSHTRPLPPSITILQSYNPPLN